MFSHYTEFWYCISSTRLNFTGLEPYLSDRIGSTVWPGSALRRLVSAGGRSCHRVGCGGSRTETKLVTLRSHSGREELQIIPRALGGVREECEASHIIWTCSDPSCSSSCRDPTVLFFSLGYEESSSVPPMILPGNVQGWPNQAHSLSFCVPFCKSFSWITALIVFFLFLDLSWPAFLFYFSI